MSNDNLVHRAVLLSLLVLISLVFVTCSDVDYVDPNEDAANVAAKEQLRSFSWVKDLYVSPGHMNIGVIPDEKKWSAPMITLAVCSMLKGNGSDLRLVRFVNVYEIAAGKSPRQAEIVVVDCLAVEPLRARIAGDREEPEQSHSATAPDSAVAGQHDAGQRMVSAVAKEYEVISTSRNNLVENYHIWVKGSDLSEVSLGPFAASFTEANCRKPCNLYIYDKRLDEALVTKYPLRGSEYIEVADHLVAYQIFSSPGELWMWSLKDFFYDETKAALASDE